MRYIKWFPVVVKGLLAWLYKVFEVFTGFQSNSENLVYLVNIWARSAPEEQDRNGWPSN